MSQILSHGGKTKPHLTVKSFSWLVIGKIASIATDLKRFRKKKLNFSILPHFHYSFIHTHQLFLEIFLVNFSDR